MKSPVFSNRQQRQTIQPPKLQRRICDYIEQCPRIDRIPQSSSAEPVYAANASRSNRERGQKDACITTKKLRKSKRYEDLPSRCEDVSDCAMQGVIQ